MKKVIEVSEIESYSKRLCGGCDLNIAKYEMDIIENEEIVANMFFCKDCFNEFVDLCYIMLSGEDNTDEKHNM